MTPPTELHDGPQAWSPILSGLNLVWLGLLVFGVSSQTRLGLGGTRLVALVLLVVAVASWLGWVAMRTTGPHPWGALVLGVMALSGGALAAFAPLAIIFPAVAALGTTMAWSMRTAIAVGAAGCGATFVSVAAVGHPAGVSIGALAAMCGGLVVGTGRRQAVDRARQATLMSVQTERAEVERARAESAHHRQTGFHGGSPEGSSGCD